ncbi:DUF2339 domain-containing protein [Rapidithrix thailandica]|uniref:DUF2339 domain-containing protein n=1 Tax=Rapidithrix thailandica TaxID=413964 RepID=A0AAW9RNR4_9BACT
MAEDPNKLNELLARINSLQNRQEHFQREINQLKAEVLTLQLSSTIKQKKETVSSPPPVRQESTPQKETVSAKTVTPVSAKPSSPEQKIKFPKVGKSNLEEFIGGNLINKVGILILIIGVAIGIKYAIDNELINPLTRIVLGYLTGFGLLGFAAKLKKKYHNFSAVLLSGAMAILYFVTFAAYDFYALIPQLLTFGIMVIFTGFTVFAAIQYNQKIIAHIGLVGAYAVPFLLSEGSGKVVVLFSYVALVNLGILAVAFQKYWKSLYYSAFGFTWIIFASWLAFNYSAENHLAIALSFSFIYFIIFYAVTLGYKLIRNEALVASDVIMMLLNAFLHYGFGFSSLNSHALGDELLGLYTLANGVIHFGVSYYLYKQKKADRNLFYLTTGMVLTFITLAIPVQLDGNWVTLLWAGEAILMCWIGRAKKVTFYERLSYVLMILAFFSLQEDLEKAYSFSQLDITPVFNIHFLTAMLVAGAFAGILYLQKKKYPVQATTLNWLGKIMMFAIPAMFLLTLYIAGYMEIANGMDQLYDASIIQLGDTVLYNFDLIHYKTLWLLNFSLLFIAVVSWVNIRKLQNNTLTYVTLLLSVITLCLFYTTGLLALGELRESYLSQLHEEYYQRGVLNILIKYLSFGFAGSVVYTCFLYSRHIIKTSNFRIAIDALFYLSLLVFCSNELVQWMDLMKSTQSDKLGLSILWGVFSLVVILLGFKQNKKHLRIGAICLFSVTLLKLFFYDIAHLDTLAKTMVFVSLGILLLVISFLYNKYKNTLLDEK